LQRKKLKKKHTKNNNRKQHKKQQKSHSQIMKVPSVYLNQPGRKKKKKSPSFTICGIEKRKKVSQIEFSVLFSMKIFAG